MSEEGPGGAHLDLLEQADADLPLARGPQELQVSHLERQLTRTTVTSAPPRTK
jgi:hypothetical protein